jgi:predicted metal-dependent RNase
VHLSFSLSEEEIFLGKSKMASTGLKRRGALSASASKEEDKLVVTPLGAGNEVGRSCVYMSYKGKSVLVCLTLTHTD